MHFCGIFHQINKELAELIIVEITSQCFYDEPNVFISIEKSHVLLTIDDGIMLDMTDTARKQIQKVIHYIKCIIESTSNAVEDTEASVWEAINKDLDEIVNRVKGCRNHENRLGELRYIINSFILLILPIIESTNIYSLIYCFVL